MNKILKPKSDTSSVTSAATVNKDFEPMIYLAPHTHYDAIWVFNKKDYFHINIDFIL